MTQFTFPPSIGSLDWSRIWTQWQAGQIVTKGLQPQQAQGPQAHTSHPVVVGHRKQAVVLWGFFKFLLFCSTLFLLFKICLLLFYVYFFSFWFCSFLSCSFFFLLLFFCLLSFFFLLLFYYLLFSLFSFIIIIGFKKFSVKSHGLRE